MKDNSLCTPHRFIETIFQIDPPDGHAQPIGFLCREDRTASKHFVLTGRVFPGSRLYNLLLSRKSGKGRVYFSFDGFDFYRAVTKHEPPRRWHALIDGYFTVCPGMDNLLELLFTPYHIIISDNIHGLSRADYCIVEILIWYTKYLSSVISIKEYEKYYELCSQAVLRSSKDEKYREILEQLAPPQTRLR